MPLAIGVAIIIATSMEITIRHATPEDAAAVCDVVRRSIAELCAADHHNDQKFVDAWLSNKTPDRLRTWITGETNATFVALADGRICGVAMISRDGELQLCYVAPEVQFPGTGQLLLKAVEQQAVRWNLDEIHLTSTLTAKRFYERHGFSEGKGSTATRFGLPMIKSLRFPR